MHRQPLLALLNNYTASTDLERQMVTDTIDFVTSNPACFERSLLIGHITGSAGSEPMCF